MRTATLLTVALGGLVLAAAAPSFSTKQPEEQLTLYEGDILQVHLTHEQRNLVLDPGRLWPNKTVIFKLSDDYHPKEQLWIREVVASLQRKTCVQFKERENEENYLFLRNKLGCASPVGFYPVGKLEMFLQLPQCAKWGTSQHEFLHALGFWHEHTRPDRDKYVEVQWDNVIQGAETNFMARLSSEAQFKEMPYDYGSVMHYRDKAFAKDPKAPTLVPLEEGAQIGQRKKVSQVDVAKLNRLYDCGPEFYLGDELVQEVTTPTTTSEEDDEEEIIDSTTTDNTESITDFESR